MTALLAECHRLTLYGTTDLELALRRDLPPATVDPALRKVPVQAGVTVLLGVGWENRRSR